MTKGSGRTTTSQSDPDIRHPQGKRLDEGLAFIRKQLDQSDALIPEEPFGDKYERWNRVTNAGLKDFWGVDSDEYSWFDIRPVPMPIRDPYMTDAQWEARLRSPYETTLRRRKTALQSILDRYEALPPAPSLGPQKRPVVKAFVSHHGDKPSLRSVEEFLRALGIEPVVVEKSASYGKELHSNVDEHRTQSQFAVVIFSKDEARADGEWAPSGSVLAEAGELREQFHQRVIYLKEKSVSLPPMFSTLQYEPFTEDDMGPACLKIARELQAWGFLTVEAPPAQL